jgi:hypothetical protein
MRVVATDRHRGHAPLAEIESSGLQPPFEHPGRADAIHDTLSADERFELVEPDDWGPHRSPRSTIRGSSTS